MQNDYTGKTLTVNKNFAGLVKGQKVYCDYHHISEKYVCVTNVYGCPEMIPYNQWFPVAIFKEESWDTH